MGFTDIGTGVMDWNALWKVADELMIPTRIAEHDQPDDWKRFARGGAQALKKLWLGQRL
jgi:hypothetical protein